MCFNEDEGQSMFKMSIFYNIAGNNRGTGNTCYRNGKCKLLQLHGDIGVLTVCREIHYSATLNN